MSVIVPVTSTQLLDVMRGQLGVTEKPFGSNKTPYGEWAVKTGHPGMNGVAWCNIFQSWSYDQADMPIPFFAYTPSSLEWFRKNGAIRPDGERPEPGDPVWFDFPGAPNRISHIGTVEGVLKWGSRLADQIVGTIEGNTNEAGGRTGGKVMRHNRSRAGAVVVFGKITFQGAPAPDTEDIDMPVIYEITDGTDKGKLFLFDGNYKHINSDGLFKEIKRLFPNIQFRRIDNGAVWEFLKATS